MVTRRELVTAGALGALSTAAGAEGTALAEAQSNEQISAEALRAMRGDLARIQETLDDALTVGRGVVSTVRKQFEVYVRTNQKYPDYCEIGLQVFTDLYDWHVRYQQPLEITRVDNRTALRFMFTWMVLVPGQDPAFIGIPYDRG